MQMYKKHKSSTCGTVWACVALFFLSTRNCKSVSNIISQSVHFVTVHKRTTANQLKNLLRFWLKRFETPNQSSHTLTAQFLHSSQINISNRFVRFLDFWYRFSIWFSFVHSLLIPNWKCFDCGRVDVLVKMSEEKNIYMNMYKIECRCNGLHHNETGNSNVLTRKRENKQLIHWKTPAPTHTHTHTSDEWAEKSCCSCQYFDSGRNGAVNVCKCVCMHTNCCIRWFFFSKLKWLVLFQWHNLGVYLHCENSRQHPLLTQNPTIAVA